ncbi:KGG domain-containing protein [Pseudomonas sp. SLFW]|uniref:general stress protein n=1 Tax=Pseudomonas TaxID=286 RepID=UPI0014136175|nr:KGG domain-containing protein [Pseudomonas sp. SLFW]NBB09120.1 general stress protein [Pseudomonas sp. SLFW]
MANTGKSNPGNFSNDRQKASDAGKKGGQASGGSNMANDRQKATDEKRPDASKKGGMPQGGAGRKS